MARPSKNRRWHAAVADERRESGMTKRSVTMLGIDLGKSSCSLVGLDAAGAVVLRRRARRETILDLSAKLPPCVVAIVVAMEACCGAHHLGRLLAAQGHTIRLM